MANEKFSICAGICVTAGSMALRENVSKLLGSGSSSQVLIGADLIMRVTSSIDVLPNSHKVLSAGE